VKKVALPWLFSVLLAAGIGYWLGATAKSSPAIDPRASDPQAVAAQTRIEARLAQALKAGKWTDADASAFRTDSPYLDPDTDTKLRVLLMSKIGKHELELVTSGMPY